MAVLGVMCDPVAMVSINVIHNWTPVKTVYYSLWPETLYHRDDVLLYIAYVMLIWAATIPADRWHSSLWP